MKSAPLAQPANTPAEMRSPWAHFSAKGILVLGGPGGYHRAEKLLQKASHTRYLTPRSGAWRCAWAAWRRDFWSAREPFWFSLLCNIWVWSFACSFYTCIKYHIWRITGRDSTDNVRTGKKCLLKRDTSLADIALPPRCLLLLHLHLGALAPEKRKI